MTAHCKKHTYLLTYLLRSVQTENILREKKISHEQFTYFGQTYPGIVISIYLPVYSHSTLYFFYTAGLSELKKLKHKYGGMPTNNDLTGAAKALVRLRSTYNLDLRQFSNGDILGLATQAQLNAKDSFFVGRFAYMAGQYYEAKKWLELTAFQVAAEPHNETTVSQTQLDQMLAHLGPKVGKVSPDNENDDDISQYKLGIVPPKTQDRDKMVTDGDNLNFAALCRGVDLLPANVAKDLRCYLSTNDPYYKLHPLQVYFFLFPKEIQC